MSAEVEAAREAIEAAVAELDEPPTVGKVVARAFSQREQAHRLDTYVRLAREHLDEIDELQTAGRDDTPRRGRVS